MSLHDTEHGLSEPSMTNIKHVKREKRNRTNLVKPHAFQLLYYGADVIYKPPYTAPFPSEYYRSDGQLWMCARCLRYFSCPVQFRNHALKCKRVYGHEVYREQVVCDDTNTNTDKKSILSIMRVDGHESKRFCQALCLLAKLFLDHKTLYYDTDGFLFYVLVKFTHVIGGDQNIRYQQEIVGYFSREKTSPSGYNLSCILVMPVHQGAGFGSLLIDYSYTLQSGSPEKPLSDSGLIAYVRFWTHKVFVNAQVFTKHSRDLARAVKEVSVKTGITRNDLMACLEHLNVVYIGDDCVSIDCVRLAQLASEYKLTRKPLRLINPNYLLENVDQP